MIAWHALFSCGSNMSTYVALASAVVLIVLAFVPHFELGG